MSDDRQPHRADLPIVSLLPNIVTIAAICAGMSAIRFGFEGQFKAAVIMVLVAGILDGLDGRLARLLKSESAMGAELDSLADFVNFGVTPALVLYAWGLQGTNSAGWIAVLMFAISCVMRLARFNIDSKSEISGQQPDRFVGVPAPAGAFLVLLPMLLSFLVDDPDFIPPALVGIYMICIGFLMISRIPTYSFKKTRVSRKNVKYLLLGFAFLAAGLLTRTWATLIVLNLAYSGSVLWAWFNRNKPDSP
ncbi:CDP-diacylglycerol--serine O-phosphatidyltransferase [Sedimentitalea sp. JM2-8]|uniref:CDP-diacylglycerol--serine O-phosphatidyltransferase n=1 Tax=Sedimentitalea xiamensis TaxID=3050037 RepID=A0ABT7FJN2_9RHOB|nr:CDP-diacylglycerol--serine O-phosphatidyltransferase [Sedimentitalea xiamensis]MDK3075361.1 CDP-diacylglycerol--serine O-phosphatidyltransferase [Sedimentitalea xiamensis]